MKATPILLVASLVLTLGLWAGTASPGFADEAPPHTVAGKSEQLITSKCRARLRRDWREINLLVLSHAFHYYQGRRKAEQVIYDQLRWLLADPEAHDLIPIHEAGAAKINDETKAIVAKQRDEYTAEVNRFEKKYLGRRPCLSEDGARLFKRAMRPFHISLKDIYKAHEQLFRSNFAVQTAQADLAGQALQDADIQSATVEEDWERSIDLFQPLVKPDQ